MIDLTDLKSIIDEELADINVTPTLKFTTLEKIFTPNYNIWSNLKQHWMRLTTVFSILVLALTLGLNALNNSTEPEQVLIKSEPYIMQLRIDKVTNTPIHDDGANVNDDFEQNEEIKDNTEENLNK